MAEMRDRDLAAEEVGAVPEIVELPERAQVIYERSYGTYDGTRFDGIDPSALYDCFYVCPRSFTEVASWLEKRLIGLGWAPGSDVESAPVGGVRLPWRRWSWGREEVELFDSTEAHWSGFPPPPAGWSRFRLNYSRKPAREFASDDEYQAWFNETGDKGERWRRRAPGHR
jgi:hypothetical protein